MVYVTGFPVVAILLALAAIHIYWAFGGRWGGQVAIPVVNNAPMFKPSPLVTFMVAVALVVASAIIGTQVWWRESWLLLTYAAWAVGVIFFIRAIGDFYVVGFFKRVKNTPFAVWDSKLFSPLCLAIAVFILLTLMNKTQ